MRTHCIVPLYVLFFANIRHEGIICSNVSPNFCCSCLLYFFSWYFVFNAWSSSIIIIIIIIIIVVVVVVFVSCRMRTNFSLPGTKKRERQPNYPRLSVHSLPRTGIRGSYIPAPNTFFSVAQQPLVGQGLLLSRFHEHIQRHHTH